MMKYLLNVCWISLLIFFANNMCFGQPQGAERYLQQVNDQIAQKEGKVQFWDGEEQRASIQKITMTDVIWIPINSSVPETTSVFDIQFVKTSTGRIIFSTTIFAKYEEVGHAKKKEGLTFLEGQWVKPEIAERKQKNLVEVNGEWMTQKQMAELARKRQIEAESKHRQRTRLSILGKALEFRLNSNKALPDYGFLYYLTSQIGVGADISFQILSVDDQSSTNVQITPTLKYYFESPSFNKSGPRIASPFLLGMVDFKSIKDDPVLGSMTSFGLNAGVGLHKNLTSAIGLEGMVIGAFNSSENSSQVRVYTNFVLSIQL